MGILGGALVCDYSTFQFISCASIKDIILERTQTNVCVLSYADIATNYRCIIVSLKKLWYFLIDGVEITQHISYLCLGEFLFYDVYRIILKFELSLGYMPASCFKLSAEFWTLRRTASIVSTAQHIVYFNQNVDDQALLLWEKVLLAEKMTILNNNFCQRCSTRKKEKNIDKQNKNEPSSGL